MQYVLDVLACLPHSNLARLGGDIAERKMGVPPHEPRWTVMGGRHTPSFDAVGRPSEDPTATALASESHLLKVPRVGQGITDVGLVDGEE